MSSSPKTLWNAWRESPEMRTSAEGWITKPPGCWTEDDEQLYALFEPLPGRGTDPDRGLATIFAIMQLTDDPTVLGSLAAGPLEDFLGMCGESYLDTLHSLALEQLRLREVLGGVWRGRMSAAVWHRVELLKQESFSS